MAPLPSGKDSPEERPRIDPLRFAFLALSFAIDRLRRVPIARSMAPFVPWLIRGLFLAGFVVFLLWGIEKWPQRISLADLASGKLAWSQSWIIVSGELQEENGSTAGLYLYRLTDAATPNARLDVRSPTRLPIGETTVSGRIAGGEEIPLGEPWSAQLDADAQLASEQPPPFVTFLLAGVGLLILVARRTSYPWFRSEVPGPAAPGPGQLPVVAHGLDGPSGDRDLEGALELDASMGTAQLRIAGGEPVPVRLFSAFTSLDVGVIVGLSSSEPALRVLAAGDELFLGFTSRQDRDTAFATLFKGGQPGRGRGQRST